MSGHVSQGIRQASSSSLCSCTRAQDRGGGGGGEGGGGGAVRRPREPTAAPQGLPCELQQVLPAPPTEPWPRSCVPLGTLPACGPDPPPPLLEQPPDPAAGRREWRCTRPACVCVPPPDQDTGHRAHQETEKTAPAALVLRITTLRSATHGRLHAGGRSHARMQGWGCVCVPVTGTSTQARVSTPHSTCREPPTPPPQSATKTL